MPKANMFLHLNPAFGSSPQLLRQSLVSVVMGAAMMFLFLIFNSVKGSFV